MTSEPHLWYRRLPNGKQISPLGFGCASFWARPYCDETRARQTFDAALQGGINHFDTAPGYGNGLGETRLGRCLQGLDPATRVVSTKVGNHLMDGRVIRSMAPADMERSFEHSLRRLDIGHVDILYLHGPALHELTPEVFRFFDRLRRDGRITYAGVNTLDPAVLDRVAATPIDAAMLEWNIGNTTLLPQVERLAAAGKIILSGTTLARAQFDPAVFLPRDRASLWYLARMARDNPLFWWHGRRLRRQLRAIDPDPYAAAIRHAVADHRILSNLFGSSRAEHVTANIMAARRGS